MLLGAFGPGPCLAPSLLPTWGTSSDKLLTVKTAQYVLKTHRLIILWSKIYNSFSESPMFVLVHQSTQSDWKWACPRPITEPCIDTITFMGPGPGVELTLNITILLEIAKLRFLIFFFLDKFSICILGWPQTHHPPVSVFQVLRWQACTMRLRQTTAIFKVYRWSCVCVCVLVEDLC